MNRGRLSAVDLALVMVVTVLWGGNVIAIKLTTAAMPPFLATALRFASVAVLVLPFYRPTLTDLKHLLPVAVVMGLGHYSLLFMGLSGLDAATGSIVTQMGVPFSVILAWIVLKDRLDRRRISGLVLAFLGVVVLAGVPQNVDLVSVLVVLTSDLMWAIAMLLIKRAPPIPPMTFTSAFACIAAPSQLLVSWVVERDRWPHWDQIPPTSWVGLTYTVIGASLIAHTLWYALLRRLPLSQVAPYTLLAPLVAFSVGALYLGEPITPIKVVGGLLTLVGVAIIEMRGPVPQNLDEQT